MTRPSRGISDIQEKARGKKMAKKMPYGGEGSDPRKAAAPKRSKKSSLSIKAKSPALDSMSVGSAMAPMPAAAGLRSAMPGMKKGGSCGTKKMSCGGSMKGYAKGGSIDGVIKKGRTRGKIC